MKWREYSEQNRRAWNEIAEVRSRSYREAVFEPEFFGAGHSMLDVRGTDAVGAVIGAKLLHLMCATGEETMSWSALGATAVGVDISDRQIELARSKAEIAGLDTHFIAADISELPSDLLRGEFDLAYSGSGALVWLPDLSVWAEAIARALKPGGKLIVWEEHPVAACFDADGPALRLAYNYFNKVVGPEVGWGHFEGGGGAKEEKYEFDWTLGEILTSVARAGLVLTSLTEYPSEEAWRFGDALEAAQGLPGRFLLVAGKPPVP